MKALPADDLRMLICPNCGALQQNVFLPQGKQNGLILNCAQNCINCGYIIQTPDAIVRDGVILLSFREHFAAAAEPVKEAERIASVFRLVKTPEQIDAAIEENHLEWLRPLLPASRVQWLGIITLIVAFATAFMLTANIEQDVHTESTTNVLMTLSATEAVEIFKSMQYCRQLAFVMIKVTCTQADPGLYMTNLKHKLESLNTAEAFRRAREKTWPFLEQLRQITPERVRDNFDYWFPTIFAQVVMFLYRRIFNKKTEVEEMRREIEQIIAENRELKAEVKQMKASTKNTEELATEIYNALKKNGIL